MSEKRKQPELTFSGAVAYYPRDPTAVQRHHLAVAVADEMDRIVADRRLHDGQPIPYEELFTVACDAVFSREIVPTNLNNASFAYQVTTMYTDRVARRF